MLMGTPWNLYKDCWGSVDPTLREMVFILVQYMQKYVLYRIEIESKYRNRIEIESVLMGNIEIESKVEKVISRHQEHTSLH